MTSIGSYAFSELSKLKGKVTLPSSVTAVYLRAFTDTMLSEVDFSKTSIDSLTGAFENSPILRVIKLPPTIKNISNNTFSNCPMLESINIDSGVMRAGKGAFEGCAALTNVTFPETVSAWTTYDPEIGERAFSGCAGLENMTIPMGMTYIGDEAFKNCTSLKWVKIMDPKTDLDGDPFKGCKEDLIIIAPLGSKALASLEKNLDYKTKYRLVRADDPAMAFPQDISTFSLHIDDTVYNGLPQTPEYYLLIDGTQEYSNENEFSRSLYQILWYNNTDAGTATGYASPLASGWHYGSCSAAFSIKPADIGAAAVTVRNVEYNGKAQKPVPEVRITLEAGEQVLKAGKDFTCTYTNNKKIGTAKITIKGTGNYTGTAAATFKILKPVRPKATVIRKLTPGSGRIKVTWKKRTKNVTGYQIQYALNKTFTKGKKTVSVKGAKKTSRVLKKLKHGKTYYIRVRPYRTIGKKNYSAKWSKWKKATAK